MVYMSLMELMKREDAICREIQLDINILAAAEAAEAEGVRSAEESAVVEKANNELPKLLADLHKVRAEMGGRVMMLEEIAAGVIRQKLEGRAET